jgi:hypothetical protein
MYFAILMFQMWIATDPNLVLNKGFAPVSLGSLYPDWLIPIENCLLVDAP